MVEDDNSTEGEMPEMTYCLAGDILPEKESLEMLPGKTLVIGPSRAGKSYFSEAFKAAGLHVVDTDKDTDLIKWRNDFTGEQVEKPRDVDDEWLAANHFVIKAEELEQFLATQGNVIMFANCWNIMDVIGQFDRVAYMSLTPDEVERRLQIERADHDEVGTPAELEFFRQRHRERSEQAKQKRITLIDATLPPTEFYNELSQVGSNDW